MRREIQLIGETYVDPPATSQESINWIPEQAEVEGTRSPLMLRGLPGLTDLGVTVTDLLAQGVPSIATIGVAYTFSFVATGGTEPYSFIYAGLPPGLTGTDETISGTPTLAGRFTVTVTVTDADGAVVSANVSLFVAAASGEVPDSGSPPSDGSGGSSSPVKPALLPNAGFEDGDTDWTVVSRTPSVSPGFTIENASGYDGSTWVCRWTGTTEDANEGPDYFENSKAVWVSGSYAPVVYVRCTAIDPGARALAGIAVRIYADSAKTTLVSTVNGGQAVFTATGDWRAIRLSGTTGPYVSVAVVAECTDGEATLEYDAVTFNGNEYVTGYNAVPLDNGDFQAGDTGWTVLNEGAGDSFAIVNDGSTWLLRWTCTSPTTTESKIVNDASFLNAMSETIIGRVSARCTSITSGAGLEAYAAVSITAYNDAALTDVYAQGSQVSYRPQGTTPFNVITGKSTRNKYLQFTINCGANTPCVLEFDLASWNGQEALPPP